MKREYFSGHHAWVCAAVLTFCISSAMAGGGPANDDCANAQPVVFGNFVGSNLGATIDGHSSCDSPSIEGDVWFRYDVVQAGYVDFNTCGSSIDTILSLHSGCPGTEANQIVCNDDAGGYTCSGPASQIIRKFNPGQIIYIRIAGAADNDQGSFHLNVGAPAAPANDNCANATTITPDTFFYTAFTQLATRDGSSLCPGGNNSPDVWFKYVAPATGALRARLCNGDFDTVLSAYYGGCPGDGRNELICNDDSQNTGCPGAAGASEFSVGVFAGLTYYLRVAGYSGASGVISLGVELNTTAEAGAGCSGTIISYGTYTGSTAGLGTTFTTSCAGTGPDVVYAFIAPEDALVNFNTCGSSFNTTLSIHSACPMTVANTLLCATDSSGPNCAGTMLAELTMAVARNKIYYVRVAGSAPGMSGNFQLQIQPNYAAVSANDACFLGPTVGLGTFSGTLAGSTNDGANDCSGATVRSDVWLRFVAPVTGPVDFSLCGSAVPATVSVHTACPGTIANQVGCSDASAGPICVGSGSGETKVNVTAGQSYWVRVASKGFDGAYTLTIKNLAPPQNNACLATSTYGNGSFYGNSLGATSDGSSGCQANSPPDQWFVIQRPAATSLNLNTCGSAFDTVLSVHTGCPGTAANQIACDDDGGCGSNTSSLNFDLAQNVVYYVRLAGFNNKGGDYILNIGPTYDGRALGDFDDSHCTDLNDFLFMLDNWQAVSSIGPPAIGITDFLALLDNWQMGPAC